MPAWENDAALAVAAASMAAIDHLVARASSWYFQEEANSVCRVLEPRSKSRALSNEGHSASFTPRPLGTRPLVR